MGLSLVLRYAINDITLIFPLLKASEAFGMSDLKKALCRATGATPGLGHGSVPLLEVLQMEMINHEVR